MRNPRLYYGPEVTKDVLRLIIKGYNTRKELAEELDCAEQTVYNKIHDPKHLGFLERDGDGYVISDKEELMKLFQLDKREILKKRFKGMSGVEEINDELVGGSLTFIRVGRLVSYYTDSEAIDEEAFLAYGRVYSYWFDYLGMGYASRNKLSREKPPNYEKKSTRRSLEGGYPKVRPDKVLEGLSIIADGTQSTEEVANYFEFSERQAAKLIGTCHVLGLTEKDGDVELTDFGRKVLDSDSDLQKELLRDSLLRNELVRKYWELSPEEPFKNQKHMRRVSKNLNRNWNETTIQTKAKRLYRWLIFTGLFDEMKRGTLVKPTSSRRDRLKSLEDYAK